MALCSERKNDFMGKQKKKKKTLSLIQHKFVPYEQKNIITYVFTHLCLCLFFAFSSEFSTGRSIMVVAFLCPCITEALHNEANNLAFESISTFDLDYTPSVWVGWLWPRYQSIWTIEPIKDFLIKAKRP